MVRIAQTLTVAFLNPARRRQGGVGPSEAMARGEGRRELSIPDVLWIRRQT
jgi:hypothetical protein